MILLLKLIFITSLLVLGYTVATQENMVFHGIRKWAEKKKENGSKWAEPLFLCHWCQSSSWSLISFAFAFGLGIIQSFTWSIFIYYILTVCGSSLLNGFVWGFHLKQNAEKECAESIKEVADILIENGYEEYDTEEQEELHYYSQHN